MQSSQMTYDEYALSAQQSSQYRHEPSILQYNPHAQKQTRVVATSDEDWKPYKEVILWEKQYGMAHLKNYMLHHHGFTATDGQWRYRIYTTWKHEPVPTQRPSLPLAPPPAELTQTGVRTLPDTTERSGFQPSDHGGGIMPPSSSHEEEEEMPSERHVILPHQHGTLETLEWSPACGAAQLSPVGSRSPIVQMPTDRRARRQPSPSTIDSSLFERNNSAASSYHQIWGTKRPASLSSQSTAPSPKRSMPFGLPSSTPDPGIQEEVALYPARILTYDEMAPTESRDNLQQHDDALVHQSQVPDLDLQQLISMPTSEWPKHDRYMLHQVLARVPAEQLPPKLLINPTRTEMIVQYPGGTPKNTALVRTRATALNKLLETLENTENGLDISPLEWEQMRCFLDAAEIFTAAGMNRPSFDMHYQVYTRLKSAESCPWGNLTELLVKQALACARVAQTKLDVRKSRRMLIEQLRKHENEGNSHDVQLRLQMALADICYKRGDLGGSRYHREAACKLLAECDRKEGTKELTAPDFGADLLLMRAHAFRACMESSTTSPENTGNDELTCMPDASKQVWSQLASSQQRRIMKSLRWCRNQLATASDEDIKFLRGSFGAEPSQEATRERLNIAALFGLFLTRMNEISMPVFDFNVYYVFGDTSLANHGLEDMDMTSKADVLWVMASLIVKNMESSTIARVFADDYFEEAKDIASSLIALSWGDLSTGLCEVVTSELASSRPGKSRSRRGFGAAERLVMTIVQRDLGIILEGHEADLEEPPRSVTIEPYHALSIGRPPPAGRPSSAKRCSGSKSAARWSKSSTDTDGSNHSSKLQAVKDVFDRAAKRFSASLSFSTHSSSSRSARDSWRSNRTEGSADGLREEPVASTEAQSPSRFRRWKARLSLGTFKDVHDKVERLFREWGH